MSGIHIILQGKGGVGKTMTAWWLGQYFANKGELRAYDLDSVNPTFSQYKALNPTVLPILTSELKLNGEALDKVFGDLFAAEVPHVLDVGASGFVPLLTYLADSGILEMLLDAGKEVCMHTVVTGGPGAADTLVGASMVLDHTVPGTKSVIWSNPFFGDVSMDGKGLRDFKMIKASADKLSGIVEITKRNDLFVENVRSVAQAGRTANEALSDNALNPIVRQRIKVVRDDIFGQLDAIFSI